ncbi:peptidoglycan DD-metalloendopeptidase family protein [Streptomyces violaceoruber]|uniref:Secreted peptidase n=3 Tax=Streptomyces TaxID=1883 RepID=Q9X7W8_STRCO|nr:MULTISPECIES: M23 family metallopeptidase [Streptomyces]MBQ0954060.1 peptidoglycan DD-metalloendopeptidase family protein [Streptomyces sp. RK76]MCW8123095.1 peptidoglycan DD-metalloendopeptidase family protein [Streptomyces anthocyanicus]MCZ4635693.1 peptidoglycan DD-metalloendopeptidase family protein [Streptomyces rubrogriseus]MDX2930590.1 peptidoglycan DD-metalloendopeptidase family protein [Streptomyces sp. NRRL_B-16638]MDX3347448.1 peptidoglycan DD-metalloendopeptidase family protein 
MPAKGKHRRTRAMRLTRTIAVAGTGGAALALPLMGAAAANAAPAHSVSEQAVQSVPASAKKAAAEKNSDSRTYTVKSGDYLSKIADEQDVDGGWKKLYADNREAVGSDPSLIHPGLKLSIDGQAAKPSAPSSAQSQKPAQKSAEKPAEKTAAKPAQKSTDAEKASSSDTGSQSTGTTSGYTSPVAGGTVGTPYHQSGSMWSSGYHTGTDFVVPTGTSLKAVGAGTVVSAGWGGAYGNQVVIQLADGHYAQYAHLSSLSVSAGQSVTAGQQVGLSGATGNVTGPHLHFEIRTTPDYGSDIDPLAFLRSHGVSV